MKRHGSYTVVFRNETWVVYQAQGGINQCLVKNKNSGQCCAFARYDHKPAIFAEQGTPFAWLPQYIRARVAKALGCCDTLETGKSITCAY